MISNCDINSSLSTEQIVQDHTFICLVAGSMLVYDGSQQYKLVPGDYGVARRNHLARYTKQAYDGDFRKIYISFEQRFLKEFNETYKYSLKERPELSDSIIKLDGNKFIDNFIQSLMPYFDEKGIIDGVFLDIKRRELLVVLLETNPLLADILFDFNDPGKINLEDFMNRNFKFNVTLDRFAFLTGRSLSTFKRDFKKKFNMSPGHWLIRRRLEEAYFLIMEKNKKPSDIYLDLGFEDFSHFSFAFKKKYGASPGKIKDHTL